MKKVPKQLVRDPQTGEKVLVRPHWVDDQGVRVHNPNHHGIPSQTAINAVKLKRRRG